MLIGVAVPLARNPNNSPSHHPNLFLLHSVSAIEASFSSSSTSSTSSSATAMKAINFMANFAAPTRITNPTTFPPWPPTKPTVLTRYSQPRIAHTLSLTRCSAKPNSPGANSSPRTPNPPTISSLDPVSMSSVGLVFDLGLMGSWDSAEIGSPVVKRFVGDEEERWCMWYHGRSTGASSSDCVGLAVSGNGVHWERGAQGVRSNSDVGLVMGCSNDWWAFDTVGIRPGDVMVMSSLMVRGSSAVYWLYYTGYSAEEVEEVKDGSLAFKLENPETGANEKVLRSLPGLAMSQDGRHWARIEGEHHSGALFEGGPEGDWDSTFIASPNVVFHAKGDIRMYYHSFDATNGGFAIGIARSRDGMKWLKLGRIGLSRGGRGSFDEIGMVNGNVVKNQRDGSYVMAYEGVGADGVRSIGLAVSSDGLKDWRKVQEEAILKPAKEDNVWDNKGVGSPCLVQMDGEVDEWRLYYRGDGNEGKLGIGMAVSQGSDIRSFRRWTGFQL